MDLIETLEADYIIDGIDEVLTEKKIFLLPLNLH